MYEVSQETPSPTFQAAWRCAGQHLQRKGGDEIKWLRADLNPPLAEHLSFRLGNQLFFVYVEAPSVGRSPSSKDLFEKVANEANAIPCIFPVESVGETFQPKNGDWGLRHARSGETVDPPSLVSSELIEMSDWELHDFAIQVVTSQIEESGATILSKQPSRHIDPSVWFRDEQGPAFVIIRSVRYPEAEAPRPRNIAEIKTSCEGLSRRGFFASVAVASADQQSESASGKVIPLYRGQGMFARYLGLESL